MQLETFQNLMISFNFKNLVNIKHLKSDNEIHFIFEHRRDKSHPHGKLRIFSTYCGISFAHDDANSIWIRFFPNDDWKLKTWAEDEN